MYTNKEWLSREFLEKNRSADDIGKECGVTNVTIRWWARKFGFRRRRWGSKKLNECFFDKITTRRQAYWLGFIAADGTVQNKPRKRLLSIVLSNKDRKHLELFREHIGSEHNIYYFKRDRRYQGYDCHSEVVQLDLPSSRLVTGLIKQGVVPNKTRTLQPPKLPRRLIRHWIRGYFDGDGCISRSAKGKLAFDIVGTRPVMEFIERHLPTKLNLRKMRNVFVLSSRRKTDILKIADYLYNRSDVYLERKKDTFERI